MSEPIFDIMDKITDTLESMTTTLDSLAITIDKIKETSALQLEIVEHICTELAKRQTRT
jgi:hypothetical protein